MPKILRRDLGTMSAVPSECVWGLKIVKNGQRTPRAGSETTEWVRPSVLCWKGGAVGVASRANPTPKTGRPPGPRTHEWGQG